MGCFLVVRLISTGVNFAYGKGLRSCPDKDARQWQIQRINLDLADGDHVALMGVVGAGKSTLLKVLSGNLAPNVGSVERRGTSVALLGGPQSGLRPDWTVLQNIRQILMAGGFPGWNASEVLDDIIANSELVGRQEDRVRTLSQGMKTRLRIAILSALEADIGLYDEAISALGETDLASAQVNNAIGVYSSHNIRSLAFCNKGLWLHRGQVRMFGDYAVVSTRYHDWLTGNLPDNC